MIVCVIVSTGGVAILLVMVTTEFSILRYGSSDRDRNDRQATARPNNRGVRTPKRVVHTHDGQTKNDCELAILATISLSKLLQEFSILFQSVKLLANTANATYQREEKKV